MRSEIREKGKEEKEETGRNKKIHRCGKGGGEINRNAERNATDQEKRETLASPVTPMRSVKVKGISLWILVKIYAILFPK